MATSRFFVANLPPKTKEKDLSNLFQDYGEVCRVELKTKENLVDPDDVKIIAFVTLKIDEADAQYCLNELNWQKIHGAKIKVSLAKESFLDRLKREREEAEAAAAGAGNEAPLSAEASADLLNQNVSNTRKKFSEDVDLDEDDIAPELLITKKRAASSLHNGKIVIQNFDTAPIHVIENKKTAKQLDAKSSAADQKRKESLHKMKNQYKQKKSAIQQSLSGLDTSASKKIKFSDAEEDDDADDSERTSSKQKTNIFGSDDEGDENMGLNLKPEHFGKKGEKLLQMQSHQSLDPRFKIDAKFVDDDDDDEEQEENGESSSMQVNESNVDDERNWQMGILEQVVGTKIDTSNANSNKMHKNKKMLRFDPSKNDHQKLLRTKTAEPVVKAEEKHKPTEMEAEKKSPEVEGPEVSKEVFYVVHDSLSQSLKTRGDGFSLLNMFGSAGAQSEEQRDDNLKKVTHEKILVNKLDKSTLNPFSYDSSSDSDDDTTPQATGAQEENPSKAEKQKKPKQGKQKVKIVLESFFIPKNDARLKEGAKFFRYKKNETPEDYEEVRNRLKLLIRTKITKSKKQTMGGKTKKKGNKV